MTETYQLQLLDQKQLTSDVHTYIFSNPGIEWVAGQYMGFIFPGISERLEEYEHWFSISSAPYERNIHITVRSSQSPFKQTLQGMKTGDYITAHTVDGDFAWPEDKKPIFVAGGIGITPFMSMLKQRIHDGGNLEGNLVYFYRPQTEIIFKDELDRIAATSEFKVFYTSEKPLSLEPLRDLVTLTSDLPVFLAGPVPMVDKLGTAFEQRGNSIYRDWYFGYDIRNF